jgi:Zn-dependent peptidase ImmA (M78 family)
VRGPFYRWEEVEAIAGRLHRQLTALRGEPIELPIDVDAVGEQLLGLSWLYEPIPEPRGTTIFAALHPEQRLVVLNERHVETFGRNEGLERFTKAHELGHWVLHVAGVRGQGSGVKGAVDCRLSAVSDDRPEFPDSRQPMAESLSCPLTPDPWPLSERQWQEKQANWFAAALLMPPQPLRQAAAAVDVTSWRGRYELREQCGVSISALNARLEQLGYPAVRERPTEPEELRKRERGRKREIRTNR